MIARAIVLNGGAASHWPVWQHRISTGAPQLCPAWLCAMGMALTAFTASGLDIAPTNAPQDLKKLSMEELMQIKIPTVYSASKHEQKVTEAPSSVSLVTADEIKKQGYRTIADILRSVRGFYVSYDRDYGYIGVRGFNRPGDFGGRILLLVDGHRLNEPLYDSAFNMMDFILDVDLIQRVEIIRGAGSSLYGDNAFFGVINVITRRGDDLHGAEVSGAYASLDTFSGRASYGNKFKNGLEMLLSGSYYSSEGQDRLFYPEYIADNNGIAEELDGEWAHSFLNTWLWRDFTLQGAYVSRRKDIPTASYGTVFNDPRSHTVDTRSYVTLQYAHEFANEWNLKTRLSYDHYRFDEDYPLPGANPGDPITLNRDLGLASWWGVEAQASKPLWEKHRLTLGSEFRQDFELAQINEDVEPVPALLLDSRLDAYRYSFFLQDEFAIRTNLILNAGVRSDNYSTFGNTINPRAALIYSPWEKTAFKLIYGQAYRAPNAFELYYASISQKANPTLQPEKIRSYIIAWEQYLTRNLHFTASGFLNQIRGLISQETDPADSLIVYQNIDRVETKGLDLELEARQDNGLLARVSYTLQHTEKLPTREILSNSPEHLAKLNLIAPLYADKIFSGVELQYSSRAQTLQGNYASGYWIANVNLFAQKIAKGLEVSAGVYNLFDKHYGFPGAEEHMQDIIQQDGRTFRVKLTYKF